MERAFPRLEQEGYRETSRPTSEYNCIAWAAGDPERWWWPSSEAYWPPGVPEEATIECFVIAFASLGFERCRDGTLEAGTDKIALYVDDAGVPTHAARQLASGLWTSKLGTYVDIEHTLAGLEGPAYGRVAAFLRRPAAAATATGITTGSAPHLLRFHARHPGASDVAFGDDAQGHSSYARLAETIADAGGPVLDLACGDGPLLARLAGAGRPCVGFDMSRHELAAARRRLGAHPSLLLTRGLAQSLPFARASFAAVTCHMALMLMDDPHLVITEVHRVLRPGGRFAGVVGHRGELTAAMKIVFGALRDLWAREPSPYESLGDRRTRDPESLQALLCPPFAEVSFEPYRIERNVPLAELPAFLELAYYPVDDLPAAAKAELTVRLREHAGELAGPDGLVPWSFPVLGFVAV